MLYSLGLAGSAWEEDTSVICRKVLSSLRALALYCVVAWRINPKAKA